jgi:HAE1 family hydrophobic/amphiphilic exporter-1
VEALARWATRRPVAVSVVAVAAILLGVVAWRGLPLDLLPDIKSPTIVVSVRSADRPPAEMERLYGERLEQLLFTVRGIREIRQVARTGRLIGTVVFDWGADMDLGLVDVEKAVSPIRGDPDVDEVLVRRFDPRQAPVLSLGLVAPTGRPDLAELRRVARRQVAPALERLEGVAEVRVIGGREREVQVLVDRLRLEAHGLTLQDLEARLRAANADIDAGTYEEGTRVYLVRGLSRFRSPEDVAAVVIRYGSNGSDHNVAIRVSDVARVVLADQEIDHLVRVNGTEGVGLSVYKEAGTNTVAVSRTVREALEDLENDLPGVEVVEVADEAALVEDAIADVEYALLIGVALAVLVLALFLRSFGATFVVATAVPVSLLTALFLMHFGGQSLNIMTLGGLALGAGMLVDNAIVVVESIFRRLSGGDSSSDAAARGTGEVAGPIAASTLTTIAVFIPVAFVRGLAPRLVSGLSFAVFFSLAASLAVALFLIPALSSWLLPRNGVRTAKTGSPAVERVVGGLLRRSFLVVFAAALAAAGAVYVLLQLGAELLPPADPRQFSVRLVGPPGQRVEATENVTSVVEEILRQATGDELKAMLSEVGRLPEDDRFLREEQTEENTARVIARLTAGGKSARQIVSSSEEAVKSIPGLEVAWEVGASSLAHALGTAGPPLVVEVSGQSLEDLRRAADALRASMAEQPALWNVRSSFEGGPPELRVVLDRTLADALGLDMDSVATVLETALDGRRVTAMTLGDEEREVVLRLPRAGRDDLARLPLTSPSGARLTVGDIARFVPEAGAREIFRRDQRRVARVTARIAPGNTYPKALAEAAEAIETTDLPGGLHARLAGEEEERVRTFRELRLAGIMALILVFMVLAGTFESLIHPLTVLSAVPVALIGVAAALGPMGNPVGVMAVVGLIVLSGVAVNDAILLISTARRLIDSGMRRKEALARAAGIRLRPILMTTATTVLALLPLAIGTGESAQLRAPLALTIIGGIIASTVGSLLVTPCLYLVLDRLRPSRFRS